MKRHLLGASVLSAFVWGCVPTPSGDSESTSPAADRIGQACEDGQENTCGCDGDEAGVQICTADGVFGACNCPEDNGRPTMGGAAEGAGPDSSGNSSQSAGDTTDGEQDELNSPDTPGSGSSSADEMPCRQDAECPADQFCALSDGLGAGMCTSGCRADAEDPSGQGRICDPISGEFRDSSGMDEHVLTIQGRTSLSLLFGEIAMVAVKLTDADGMPLNDEFVKLTTLIEQPLVSANRSRTQTNADGIATYTITALERAGTIELTAEAFNAQPATWNVTVLAPSQTTVGVRVRYSADDGVYTRGDIATVRVALVEGACARAFDEQSDRVRIDAPESITPFTGNDVIDIQNVPADLDFAVIATGLNADGAPFIRGCTDGVTARADERVDTEVQLEDGPFDIEGLYEGAHTFDLSCLLDNDQDVNLERFEHLLRQLEIMASGGYGVEEAFIEYYCDIGLELEISDASSCGTIRQFGTLGIVPLGEAITTSVTNAPPTYGLALLKLRDLWAAITAFNVQHETSLANAMDNPVQESRWLSFGIDWNRVQDRGGPTCPFDNMELCQQTQPFQDENGNPRPLATPIDIAVNGSAIEIAPHTVPMQLAEVYLAVFEQWYLANALPNGAEATIESLFNEILDCTVLQNALPSAELCRAITVQLAAILIEGSRRYLSAYAGLTLEGRARIGDTNLNGQVDWLYDGVWDGSFDANPAALANTIGDFNAVHQSERMDVPTMPPSRRDEPQLRRCD